MVLEMSMESVFAVVDLFWVSRLGEAAVTAVGVTEVFMAVLYTVDAGLSIGVTAVVARRIGETDPDGAAEAVVQAALLGLLLSTGLGVVGAVYAPELLRLMGAAPEVVAVGTGYTRVLVGFNGVLLFLFLFNAVFRGAGDAAIAMRVLWLANGLNLVLDPLLIFGWGPVPEMGVTGAAVATTIGRGTAVAVQLWTLFRVSDRIRIGVAHLRLRPAVMRRLLRLSGTAAFQTGVATVSWLGLVRVMASFGTEALAGYTVAIRLLLFGLLPAWGVSNAAATMVGQSLGADDEGRAEASAWAAAWINGLFLSSLGLVFLVATEWLVAPFDLEGEALRYATEGLRIMSAGFFFYAPGMVLTQAFNGAGDPWTPTWLNLAFLWGVMVPAAWLLAHPAGFGAYGAFAAVPVAYLGVTVAAGLLFRTGRWKGRAV
jgi:putative MATE family efflux protein